MALELPKTQLYIIRGPVGGLQTSLGSLDISPQKSPAMLNVRPYKSWIQKRQGLRQIGLSLGEPIMGLATFHKAGGTAIPVAWTPTKMYKWDGAAWVQVTGVLTGTSNDLISWTVVFDTLVFTNGADAIKKWDGVAAGFSDLGGAPPKAKYLCPWADRLFLGFINDGTDHPQTVAWSKNGDINDWTALGSGQKLFMHDPSYIQNLTVANNRLVIPQERSVSTAEFTGDSDNPFVWREPDLDTVGMLGPRAFQDLGGQIMFFSNGRAFVYNLSTLDPIDKDLTQDIYQLLNKSAIAKAVSLPIFNGTEWWFAYPEAGSENDSVLVFNWTEQIWYKHTIAIKSVGFFQESRNTTWGALVGTWADQAWAWGSPSSAYADDIPVIGTVDGRILQVIEGDDDNGQPINSYWQSKSLDMEAPGLLKTVKRVRIGHEDCGACDLTIALSTDEGKTFPYSVTNTLETGRSKRYTYFDIIATGETFDVKLMNSVMAQRFNVFEIALEWQIRGPAFPPAP